MCARSRTGNEHGGQEGEDDGTTAEVHRDGCHLGDAAFRQRGTRVCVARRVAWRWVVGRASGWDRHRPRTVLGAVLGAILGGILEPLCLWLPLCLPLWLRIPAGGCRPIDPVISPTLTPGVRSVCSISLVVLL